MPLHQLDEQASGRPQNPPHNARHPHVSGLTRAMPLCEVMSGEQVERIDAASMDILENVGVRFRDPIVLVHWRRAGAKVEYRMVWPDKGLIRDLIATIPTDGRSV